MVIHGQGTVWWYTRLAGDGGITYGTHPCVVVSSNEWNSINDYVTIIPCTSTRFNGTTTNMNLKIKKDGYFFISQVTTVPKKWLHDYVGMLDQSELNSLVKCIQGFFTPGMTDCPILNSSDNEAATVKTEDLNSKSSDARSGSVDITKCGRVWSSVKQTMFLDDCLRYSEAEVASRYGLKSAETVRRYRRKFREARR